jgi:membrane protease YdiL (CAAX protease family)
VRQTSGDEAKRNVFPRPHPSQKGSVKMSAAKVPLQPAAAHQSGLAGLLARHKLVSFFVLAYAGTWLVTVPLALSANGVGLLPFSIPEGSVFFVGAAWVFLGPTLAAFIMTGIAEGRAGIGRLLHRYVLWRVGLRWYLVVIIGPPVIILLVTIVLPGALASFRTLAPLDPLPLLVSFPLVLVFGGALFEEGGWRGFALLRLQRLHGPLVGSLILGVLWALWHLPLFWTPWNELTTLNVVVYVLAIICLTITYTWAFNNTKGSLLIVILIHAAFNVATTGIVAPLFPAPYVTDYGLLPILAGFGAFAVVLVALMRGRLGYQYYQQEERNLATAPTRA